MKYIINMLILSLVLFLVPVRAEENEGTITPEQFKNSLTYVINPSGPTRIASYVDPDTHQHFAYRLGKNYPMVTRISDGYVQEPNTVYAFTWTNDGITYYTTYFAYSNSPVYTVDGTTNGEDECLRIDASTDLLNWDWGGDSTNMLPTTQEVRECIGLNYSYTWSDGTITGRTIQYISIEGDQATTSIGTNYRRQAVSGLGSPKDCPRIRLNQGQNDHTILALFSSDNFSSIPWAYTTSSGGMHFPNGKTMTPEQRTSAENIFIVMDTDNSQYITSTEVENYNLQYNTNYNYNIINNNSDFDFFAFAEYIIDNINDLPDDNNGTNPPVSNVSQQQQQQQQQQQTIEENAVNVTVNNNSGSLFDHLPGINDIINNNLGSHLNTFQQAVGVVNGFSSIASSFGGLASNVFSVFPGWLSSLINLVFSFLPVMVIFRLIHLFK